VNGLVSSGSFVVVPLSDDPISTEEALSWSLRYLLLVLSLFPFFPLGLLAVALRLEAFSRSFAVFL